MDITVETKKKFTIVLNEQEMKDLMEMVKGYNNPTTEPNEIITDESVRFYGIMLQMYKL